jgi:signal transduction histidine kinase
MPSSKMSDRRLNQIVFGALALGFVALIAAVSATAWGIVRNSELGQWVAHTYQVEIAVADFRSLTERAESTRRGYILDPQPRFVDSFGRTTAGLNESLARIEELTRDNPSQVENFKALSDASERQIAHVKQSFSVRQNAGAEAARADFVADGIDLVTELRQILVKMTAEEQRLLVERRALEQSSLIASYVILAVSGLLVIILAGVTVWAIRRNLNDIKRSRDRLRELNENLEGAVLSRTADLQRANDEIQRFAYIVSHDLRSPLVNVMGFTAELDASVKPLSELIARAEEEAPAIVTEEARLAVREDLPEAIGFIRSSTQKMDRLINAILRLSREGRRVITPEPLDVGEMLEGIVGSLQHRLTELGAEVALETPMPKIVSDRVAIEQILSNLVENSVKYLQPGRPGRIVVRGRRTGGRVIYDVIDNGRGIDPKDHERIFDLFRRSGTQDQPGEGIGLAHVRALAYRLGGIITCESQLGKGATFSLSLPPQFRVLKENAS